MPDYTNSDLVLGDYVLATKYSDGDPQDHWAIGYFKGMLPKPNGDRYQVADAEGNLFRGNGFRRCKKIAPERGTWMLKHARDIEFSGKSVWHFAKCSMDEPNDCSGGEGPPP